MVEDAPQFGIDLASIQCYHLGRIGFCLLQSFHRPQVELST